MTRFPSSPDHSRAGAPSSSPKFDRLSSASLSQSRLLLFLAALAISAPAGGCGATGSLPSDDSNEGVDCSSDDPDLNAQCDFDGDGFTGSGGDCDNQDPDVYLGADEVCDEKDNDCDWIVDEGACGDDDSAPDDDDSAADDDDVTPDDDDAVDDDDDDSAPDDDDSAPDDDDSAPYD